MVVSTGTARLTTIKHKHGRGATVKTRQLVTPAEAATMLNQKESTIRRRILERRIDIVKVGKSVRIPIEAVEKLIQEGYKPALVTK